MSLCVGKKGAMSLVLCPHCKSHRIVTSHVPKNVVAVFPCPQCDELIVYFHNKAIALSRRILERGNNDERRVHLANIIGEFLEPGFLKKLGEAGALSFGSDIEHAAQPSDDSDLPDHEPISEEEIEQFVKIDLDRLDDPSYFRKYFG